MAAAIVVCANLTRFVCHVPHAIETQHTLKAYASAHALADRQIDVIGLVAVAYPAVIWVMAKLISCGR